jgi:hypothetical protein
MLGVTTEVKPTKTLGTSPVPEAGMVEATTATKIQPLVVMVVQAAAELISG